MPEQGIPSITQMNTDMVACNDESSQWSKTGLGFKVFGPNSSIQSGEKMFVFPPASF